VKLGNWISDQKTNKGKGKLSNERIELLKKIPAWMNGIDLGEQQNKIWNENYKLLKIYEGIHHEIPPQSYVTENGIHLGSWISKQKTNEKEGTLSNERIKLLKNIPGWVWDKFEEQWNRKYKLLKEYEEEYHKIPARSYVTKDGIELGAWVGTQKTNEKKGKLTDERIKLLKEIPGWVWTKSKQKPIALLKSTLKPIALPTSKPIALPKPKPKPKLTNKDQEEIKALKKRIAEISAKDPGYRGEDMLGCTTKELINDKVASYTTPNSNVLILDTEQFRTAKVLEEAGVKPENIHIPQNDDETYREMQIKQKRNNIEHCTLNTYLDKDIEYDMVWMDYCCTFDGNKNISPKEDIKKCIELNRMKEAGYLCLTFSLRNGDKKHEDQNDDIIVFMQSNNCKYVTSNKYMSSTDTTRGSAMVFYVFQRSIIPFYHKN
jgi:hypothetical protein